MPEKKRKIPRRRAIWAFDPFEANLDPIKTLTAVLKKINSSGQYAIEPVYVLNPVNLGIDLPLGTSQVRQYRELAFLAAKSRLEKMDVPELLPPRILLERGISTRAAVKHLVNYARIRAAAFVAVSTHARTGLERALLGSFAETLVLQAKTPALICRPSIVIGTSNEVLFPTDLSEASKKVYRKMLAEAKGTSLRITLLHVIPHPVEALLQTGIYLLSGALVPAIDYVSDREIKQRRIAERWAEEAGKAGIPAEVVIENGINGVTTAILNAATDRKVGWITMAAESGPVTTTLLGSVTRQVIRQAPCPVWVRRA